MIITPAQLQYSLWWYVFSSVRLCVCVCVCLFFNTINTITLEPFLRYHGEIFMGAR